MILFYLLLAALAALVLVVLLRTAAFKPKAQPAETPEALDYDGQAAIDALMPAEPAANDSTFLSALTTIQGNIYSALLMDTVNINGTTVSGQTNYPVTVVINDPQDLKPGMNVSADIIVERAGTVLCVPVDAVNRGSDKPTVQVAQEGALDENGNVVDPSKLETREVTLGRNDNDNIEITSGLSEGEIVVWVNEVSNPFAAMMGM